MTTNKFSIGYVSNVHFVGAVETLFSPNKKPLVKSVVIKVSSDDHKNVSMILNRKEATHLVK
jgi:hypothetical protein